MDERNRFNHDEDETYEYDEYGQDNFSRGYNYYRSSKPIGKILAIAIPIFVVVAVACTFLGVFLANGGLNKIFPKLFHECEFVEWKTVEEPTCISEGIRQLFCSCGKSSGESMSLAINQNNHATPRWEVTKQANCLENGLQDQKCDACNQIVVHDVSIAIDKFKHQFNILTNSCDICGEKELQEITSTGAFENADSKIVVYLDYIIPNNVEKVFTVDSSDEYIRFVGTLGKSYNLHFVIQNRTTPINIDFVNVVLQGSKGQATIKSDSNCIVNLGFYGEKNIIYGSAGSTGEDYGPFRSGGNGSMAIDVKGDLTIKVNSSHCAVYGGAGGRGGHGSVGNDGGTGGNGAMAISAKSIQVSFGEGFSKSNITIAGGGGGAGGNAGGWFFGTPSPGYSGKGANATNVEILYK